MVAVVESGGQNALCSGHGSYSVDGGRKFYAEQQPQKHQGVRHQRQIGTVAQLLAGGIAGAISKTCTAPLARLTILFQVQGMHSDISTLRTTSVWHEVYRIAHEEGLRAFWKGNLVTIIHRLPYSAISFYSYEHYKHILQSIIVRDGYNKNPNSDILVRLVGGGLAGMTAATATYPLDLVRTRLAAQTNRIYYKGISHALGEILKEGGIKGLYKGIGPTLLGVVPSIAISFSVYETLRSYWISQRPDDSRFLATLVCGGLSGMASSTAAFPLDLIRRRMQLEGACGRALVYNSGLVAALGRIVRTEGLRGLYRGILPEYLKVVPGVGITFVAYEILKSLLADEQH